MKCFELEKIYTHKSNESQFPSLIDEFKDAVIIVKLPSVSSFLSLFVLS